MHDHLQTAACCQCGRPDTLQAVTGRIGRCRLCGFFVPTPNATAEGAALPDVAAPRIPGAAPSGVLRGRYRLLRRLGEGAHGVSYLAQHEILRHPCVVKLLPQRTGDAAEAAISRLRNEARAGFEVQDPNVVRVLDCDVAGGVWYFVMEYVDGVDLGQVLGLRLRLNWRQAVRVGVDAAQGLAAIHAAGLVHRDIKPANLLLGSDNRTRVADLGVAGLASGWQEPAGGFTAAAAGTLAYAAPEVFRTDRRLCPTADLYSLGATLYHLVTGRPPHATNQVFQRLVDLQSRPVAWPRELASDTPAELVQIILRLLAIEPEDRLPDTGAVLDALRPFSNPPLMSRPVVPRDELEPRGVGVLPLRNETQTPDDDWLGYAVADSLSKDLAALPDVYVADPDVLAGLVDRLEATEGLGPRENLIEAGRRVGAATLVTGRFRRTGSRVRIALEIQRGAAAQPRPAVVLEGPLGELPNLERSLAERLSQALGLRRSTPPEPPRTATPAAREKFVLGRQAYLRGDYEEAIALAEEASRLDPESAEAVGFVGICLARLGRYEEAEAHHRRHEALARGHGNERGQIEALANLGVMYYFRGDYEAAEAHYRRAARFAEQRDLATETAQIFNNLGFVLYRLGRLEEAERVFLRAIETHRAYGGLTSLVGPYNGMGNVLAEAGRFREARHYYQRALALAVETGDRTSVGTTHVHLGRCAAQEGRFADAKHELTMALNALEETRFWNGLARAYEVVTDLHLQLGNCEEALRSVDQRLDVARQHANLRMEAAAWLQKAAVLKQAGRAREAEACEAQARDAGGGKGGAQGART